MSDSARQWLAAAVFFSLWGFMYLWLGVAGACGFGFGLTGFWLMLGLSEGVWIGTGNIGDQMSTELSRRLREHQRRGRT
jgi:hypothetical protein